MKKILALVFALLSITFLHAQQRKLVSDKEMLFTPDETNRIDNMLQEYRKKSGSLVVVCSDSADITNKSYQDSIISVFTKNELQKPYAVFLLLSRKNSAIQLVSSEMSKEMPSRMEEFMKIISYGVPALKEKKTEEGVTIICKKAMEFLDALPAKKSRLRM